jgi:hypothetical protein
MPPAARRTAKDKEPELRRAVATFDDLIKKPPRKSEVIFRMPGDDGEPVELVVVLQAIGSFAYDELVAAHPPTPQQKKEGDNPYNLDTFAPALISACSKEPALSLEQASELYKADNMSPGEMVALFLECLKLCNAGVDVPFTVSV